MFLLKLKEDYPWPREIHPLPKCPTILCETAWEKFLTEDSEHFLMKLKESRDAEVNFFCAQIESRLKFLALNGKTNQGFMNGIRIRVLNGEMNQGFTGRIAFLEVEL